ncbi:MAG: DUF3107 domain-containing protein [Acidimicrobiales bacterium]|nr:DUF3107 domain-containing protein [Acidimicrobiales bacterium]
MIVRIGVVQSVKEIEVDLGGDGDDAEIRSLVEGAVASDSDVLWLTDKKGRTVGVPSERIAYVELDPGSTSRLGFGA